MILVAGIISSFENRWFMIQTEIDRIRFFTLAATRPWLRIT